MNQLTRLRLVPSILFVLGLIGTLAVAASVSGIETFAGYAACSIAASAVVVSVYIRNAGRNRAPDSMSLYAGLGLANGITLVRGLILAALAGMIAVRPSERSAWLATGLYTAAIILDFFDGFAARRTRRISELGGVMDVEYDSLGVLIASILVVRFDVAGLWFLLVGAARYLFVLGAYIRRRMGLSLVPLEGSLSGRVAAGLMMGYMSAAFWPIIPIGYRSVAAIVFSVFFFASFSRDWLVTSTVIDKHGASYLRAQRFIGRFIPPAQIGSRALSCVLLASEIGRFDLPWAVLSGMLAILIFTGVAGRVAALALLLVWIFAPGSAAAPQAIDYALEAVCLLILVLGTGPFSIVSPEDAVFRR